MIHVELIGGVKKIFSKEFIELPNTPTSIADLLEILLKMKPKNSSPLDENNILIAVNGIDSSSMNGKFTILKDNDIVSIIPVIHGGQEILKFQFSKKSVHVFEIKGNKKNNIRFLDDMRSQFPQLQLQAISNKFILNKSHLQKILELSIESEKNKILLSNKLEVDILLRFAITTQISDAIKIAGIDKSNNFILIVFGKQNDLEKLLKNLKGNIVPLFTSDNSQFLSQQFNITKKHLDVVSSSSPLEDLLIEKAAVLF